MIYYVYKYNVYVYYMILGFWYEIFKLLKVVFGVGVQTEPLRGHEKPPVLRLVSKRGSAEAHDVLRRAVPNGLTADFAACERRELGLNARGEAEKGRL